MPKDVATWLKKSQAAYLLSHLYIFCRDTRAIPDYKDQPHKEMCDELEAAEPDFLSKRPRQKKKIYLAPRHSYKTSLLAAWIAKLILQYPNIRIAFGRATHEDAKTVLFKVKQILQTNPVILDVWGDLSKGALIWAEDQITVGTRTQPYQEPTVDTTGLGLSKTGFHPDLVLLDDLVNDVNYISSKTLNRSRILIQSFFPILPPHGSIVLCGTRWAYNDVYGWVMQEDDHLQEEEDSRAEREGRPAVMVRQWDRYIRSVYLPDGSLFFPDVLTEEYLEQQRRSLRLNMMLFSSWFYNQPYEEGTKLFPKPSIRFFDAQFYRSPGPHLEYPDGTYVPLRVSMTIDPAPTTGPESDFTGVTVVGVDSEAKWYVLWAEGMKKVPSDRARAVIDLIRIFAPEVVGIETGQADPEFVALLQAGLRDLGLHTSIQSYSPVRDEKPGARGKNQRIESLEPLFREGVITLRRGMPVRDLLQQLDGWPSLDHDDVIDALAMQRLFVRTCKEKTSQQQLAHVEERTEATEEAESWGPEGPPREELRKVAFVGKGGQVYRQLPG